MKTSKRKKLSERTPADRGAWILEAAGRLFAQKTFSGTSTAEIAAASGVAEGTIYRYYENKHDLLFSVVCKMIQATLNDAVFLLSHIHSPEEKIRVFIKNHLSHVDADRDAARLFIREVRGSESYRDSELRAINKAYANVLVEIIKEGQEVDVFDRNIDPVISRDIILGGLEHAVTNHIYESGQYCVDELTAAIIPSMLALLTVSRKPAPLEKLEALVSRLEKALQD